MGTRFLGSWDAGMRALLPTQTASRIFWTRIGTKLCFYPCYPWYHVNLEQLGQDRNILIQLKLSRNRESTISVLNVPFAYLRLGKNYTQRVGMPPSSSNYQQESNRDTRGPILHQHTAFWGPTHICRRRHCGSRCTCTINYSGNCWSSCWKKWSYR